MGKKIFLLTLLAIALLGETAFAAALLSLHNAVRLISEGVSVVATFPFSYLTLTNNQLPLLPPGAISEERYSFYSPYNTYLGSVSKKTKQSFIFGVDTKEPIIALTFDDGPDEYTKYVVSTLNRLQAPATFFVVASQLNSENSY